MHVGRIVRRPCAYRRRDNLCVTFPRMDGKMIDRTHSATTGEQIRNPRIRGPEHVDVSGKGELFDTEHWNVDSRRESR